MPKNKLLQPAVSRTDSIRTRWSNASWALGIANFFIQNVPFAYSTSWRLADALSKTILALFPDQNVLRLYEPGCGTGLLAQRLLTSLKNTSPIDYHGLTLSLSDYDLGALNEIRRLGILKNHLKQCHFLKSAPAFSSQIPVADFSYVSYVMSATPSRHIRFNKNGIEELQVSTLCKNSAAYSTLKKLVEKSHLNEDEIFEATRLSAALEERRIAAPFIPKNKQESDALSVFQADCRLPDGYVMTLQTEFMDSLVAYFSRCPSNAIITLIDVAQVSRAIVPESSLSNHYGLAAMNTTSFLWVKWVAEKNGWHVWHTVYPDADTQILLLAKQPFSEENIGLFEDVFGSGTSQVLDVALQKIYDLDPKAADFLPRVNATIAELQEYDANQCAFLSSVAVYLIEFGHRFAAVELLQRLLKDYGPLGVPGLLLIGFQLLELGDASARRYFDAVLRDFPNISEAHLGRALSLITKNPESARLALLEAKRFRVKLPEAAISDLLKHVDPKTN